MTIQEVHDNFANTLRQLGYIEGYLAKHFEKDIEQDCLKGALQDSIIEIYDYLTSCHELLLGPRI